MSRTRSVEQTARDHYRGSSCPKCRESHGERATRKFLVLNKINFKAEHIFETCKYKVKEKYKELKKRIEKYDILLTFYIKNHPEQNIESFRQTMKRFNTGKVSVRTFKYFNY